MYLATKGSFSNVKIIPRSLFNCFAMDVPFIWTIVWLTFRIKPVKILPVRNVIGIIFIRTSCCNPSKSLKKTFNPLYIRKHITNNNVLNDSRHGFISKRFCETQLIISIQDLTKPLVNGNQIECSKAFNKVPNQRFMVSEIKT